MEASRKLALWEISNELEAIGELIAENGGEVSEFLEAQLDAIEGAFEEKVERVALFVRECAANAEAAKLEQERLGAIRKSFENKAEGLKAYLHRSMERVGKVKVQTPRASVRVQQNSRPAVRFTGDPNTLPSEYIRVHREVDTQFAYVEHKAGATLPAGFVVEYGTHLRVN